MPQAALYAVTVLVLPGVQTQIPAFWKAVGEKLGGSEVPCPAVPAGPWGAGAARGTLVPQSHSGPMMRAAVPLCSGRL